MPVEKIQTKKAVSLLPLLTLLFLFVPAAHASFNNANSPTTTASGSVSESMTVLAPCTPNCAAVLWATTVSTGAYPSSVTATYGGSSMTAVCSQQQMVGSNFFQVEGFVLVSPATGSNTLVISASGGGSSVTATKAFFSSYTGVNQTTPVRPGSCQGTNATSSSMVSLTLSSNTQDLTTTASIVPNTSPSIFGSSQNADAVENSGFAAGADHASAPASSVTHTWMYSSSNNPMMAGFSIEGAAAFSPICSGGACIRSICIINYWFDGSGGSDQCTLTVAPNEKIVAGNFTLTTTCPNFTWSDSLSLSFTTLQQQCPEPSDYNVVAVQVASTGSNSGSDTFTLLNHQFGYSVGFVAAISGLNSLDTSAGNSATSGTALSSGNLTTAAGGEFLINFGWTNGGPPLALGSGFSLIGSVGTYQVDESTSSYAMYAEVKVTGAAGTYSGTFTGNSSGTWADIAAAFGIVPSAIRHKVSLY